MGGPDGNAHIWDLTSDPDSVETVAKQDVSDSKDILDISQEVIDKPAGRMNGPNKVD